MTPPAADAGAPRRASTTRVYSGKVISVDRDAVQFPDGSVGDLEMVRHPGASAVLPFLDDPSGPDARVVLLRQYRYAASGYLYEIPAGRLEPGESPEACAVRELEEETGYRAERMQRMFTMYTTPGFTDERIHVFLATGLHAGTAARERDEFIEVTTRTLGEAVSMVEVGDVQDSKTALGILYAAQFRSAGAPR